MREFYLEYKNEIDLFALAMKIPGGMKKQALKTYRLEEITDKHIGKRGTPKRETFKNELRLDLPGEVSSQAQFQCGAT